MADTELVHWKITYPKDGPAELHWNGKVYKSEVIKWREKADDKHTSG